VVIELPYVLGHLLPDALILHLQGEACEPLDAEYVADVLLEEFGEEEVVEPELPAEADQVLAEVGCLWVVEDQDEVLRFFCRVIADCEQDFLDLIKSDEQQFVGMQILDKVGLDMRGEVALSLIQLLSLGGWRGRTLLCRIVLLQRQWKPRMKVREKLHKVVRDKILPWLGRHNLTVWSTLINLLVGEVGAHECEFQDLFGLVSGLLGLLSLLVGRTFDCFCPLYLGLGRLHY